MDPAPQRWAHTVPCALGIHRLTKSLRGERHGLYVHKQTTGLAVRWALDGQTTSQLVAVGFHCGPVWFQGPPPHATQIQRHPRDEARQTCPAPQADRVPASKGSVIILAVATDNTDYCIWTQISRILHQGQDQQSKL